jgi:hypothetical protein
MSGRRVPPIVNSRTIPHKDGYTIIWIKDQDITNKKFKKWTALVTSVQDYIKWASHVPILALVLHELSAADYELLKANRATIQHLFVSQAVADQYQIPSVIILDTLYTQYPIIPYPYDGVLGHSLASVAILFHFTHLVDIPCSEAWSSSLKQLGIKQSTGTAPPSVCLITQYFVHKVTKRAKEFRQCLKNNLACDSIDKVILLNEADLKYEWSGMKGQEKVEQVIIGTRLTYKDLIKHTYDHVPSNTLVIYANADIYCNSTLEELYSVNMRDKMFALLRWDEGSGPTDLKLFGPRVDSQDAWIVHSDSVKERTWDWSSFDYKLGTAGCDNRFTGDMFGMKFMISNPCHSIKTVHIHKTEIRDYNKQDIIQAKLYLYIHPSSITYIEQSRMGPKMLARLDDRKTTVKIRCLNPKQAQTYVIMLAREKKFVWSELTENIQSTSTLAVQQWSNAFMTGGGLVYDYKKIYAGPNETFDPFINGSTVPSRTSFFGSVEKVDNMLAIPSSQLTTFTNPDLYCLRYLSFAIQLYNKYPDISFNMFMPQGLLNMVRTFKVRKDLTDPVQAIQWNPNVGVYAKNIYGFMPENIDVGPQEIHALREAWPPYSTVPETKFCVVLTDDLITSTFVETVLGPLIKMPIVTVGRKEFGLEAYNKIQGASLCILFNLPKQDEDWMKLWCLPKGCPTLEFQNELKVVGEFQHFAAAAELACWFMPLHKGPTEDLQGQMAALVTEWLKVNTV